MAKKKIRTDFRKNRSPRTRATDLTRRFGGDIDGTETDDLVRDERISGKGELTRRRTVVAEETSGDDGDAMRIEVDLTNCRRGRVLSVYGLLSDVEAEDGAIFRCATRRVLKTLTTDERHVVAAGDLVYFRPLDGGEGMIERIEPRRGIVDRRIRGRQHVLVANVDQLLIIASAAEPRLKPHLIDRFLLAADKNKIRPLVCINKVDLVEPASLEPLVGVYSQMGYRVLLLSAQTGMGVERLRRALAGKESVVAGQSGVGKSSLLNAIHPGLKLRVSAVSAETQKGKHTTTTARLVPLPGGGYVVDTPGIRQFKLWDIIPAEVAGYFRDLRPFESQCRYPNCTHTHETECAVKDAVADDLLDARRYESYLSFVAGDDDE